MRQLICERCGSSHYSASARTLLERGAVCEACGGPLVLSGEDDLQPTVLAEEDARAQAG